ncbi:MAG: hypothetical protein HKM04_02835, partial [Legionellales bacterium]|nr:hypothetical protein [Legionellales bacterium]
MKKSEFNQENIKFFSTLALIHNVGDLGQNAIQNSKVDDDNDLGLISLESLIKRKRLNIASFMKNRDVSLRLESEIGQHAAWAFSHIYQYDYPNRKGQPASEIARIAHGIQHTSRVALYVPVFVELYRRHGDEEAKKLTAEDIKLLQIAALFHDSARENDGEDLWDGESGVLLYFYLTRVLGVNKDKAKLIAEATAN